YTEFKLLLRLYFGMTSKRTRSESARDPPPSIGGGLGDAFAEIFHEFEDAYIPDPFMTYPRDNAQKTHYRKFCARK
ncbi:hypothetical protein Dimus_030708, partial [Dionaea muscipula]